MPDSHIDPSGDVQDAVIVICVNACPSRAGQLDRDAFASSGSFFRASSHKSGADDMQTSERYGTSFRSIAFAGICAISTTGSALAIEEAAQLKLGEYEYSSSCAACHGADAKGTGPVAEVLSTKPSDLTQITKEFSGQFPSEHIYRVIDGRNMVNPHGDKQMPVWGFRYLTEAYERAGEVPHDVDAGALVFGRIMSLVRYLESVQAD